MDFNFINNISTPAQIDGEDVLIIKQNPLKVFISPNHVRYGNPYLRCSSNALTPKPTDEYWLDEVLDDIRNQNLDDVDSIFDEETWKTIFSFLKLPFHPKIIPYVNSINFGVDQFSRFVKMHILSANMTNLEQIQHIIDSFSIQDFVQNQLAPDSDIDSDSEDLNFEVKQARIDFQGEFDQCPFWEDIKYQIEHDNAYGSFESFFAMEFGNDFWNLVENMFRGSNIVAMKSWVHFHDCHKALAFDSGSIIIVFKDIDYGFMICGVDFE